MFFKLTDEQIMIQTMAREFSRKVVALAAAERDRTKEFPSENLKKMGELGGDIHPKGQIDSVVNR